MSENTNEDWVDFTEIPSGQGGGRNKFEEFARDFLETLGYEIVEGPDIGGDRGRDLIVKDDEENIWLVSCKHYAHNGDAVNKSDETDILDRISIKSGCNNFLCFYSTFVGNSLQETLSDLKEQKGIGYDIFDRERIERYLIRNKSLHKVLARFFSK